MASQWDAQLQDARSTGVLRINDEELTSVPDGARRLRYLKRLELGESRIRDLPAWLPELKHLAVLDLVGNPLRGFPGVVTEIDGLQELGLCNTGILEVPESVSRLKGLEKLVLAGNNIQTVPKSIRRLQGLQLLDLSGNRLTSLPDELAELAHLTHLLMAANPITVVPSVLHDLTNLRTLDLGRTAQFLNDPFYIPAGYLTRVFNRGPEPNTEPRGLIGLPSRLFENLAHLEWLRLTDNRIEQLPRAIRGSSKLTGLFMARNRMGTFPEGTLPTSLQFLDLSGNRISTIPRGLEDLRQLRHLDLTDNPLPLPPEILAKKDEPQAISSFVAHITNDTRRLDEAKVIVVGEGSVGKTSLIKRIVHNQFSRHEARTEGIEITPWIVTTHAGVDVTLNTWDFGGQEIMHATHQFFLTKRSVYVLVIDARQDEDQNRLEHWLKTVQGYSGGSPIIVVGNKVDESHFDIDVRGLTAKYPDITKIFGVSCQDSTGMDELRDALTDAVSNLPHVSDLLPESFFEVKTYLEGMEADYISFRDFEDLCRANGIYEKGSQEYLVDFLHDLGTVLCFRDDPRLANTNILNPTWVTTGVYMILNSLVANQKKGLLSQADVHEILGTREYPVDRRFFIIDMMKRFELCYEDDNTFLVPDLLTKSEPYTGKWDEALTLLIKYDVLPPGLMSRFIVRMKEMISQETVWRNGVVLYSGDERALVKADREDAVLSIQVVGPTRRGRIDLLAAIRGQARLIAQTVPGLTYDERVPTPGATGITVSYSHLVEMDAVGRTHVIPEGQTDEFSIRQLLDGIENPLDRLTTGRDISAARIRGQVRRRARSRLIDGLRGRRTFW
jgi:small GTP-binding protein domain